ncbi:hypothetical protein BJ170DRAFT_598304 [Xylariales sp. AK1849]|nr:hypothetical protein BJ170DRAFT_598304 [Xylariales sp. AK1849]
MRSLTAFAVINSWFCGILAAPASVTHLDDTASSKAARQIIGDLLDGDLLDGVGDLLDGVTNPTSVLSILEGLTATATPTDFAQVSTTLEAIYSATPTNIYVNVGAQIQAGITPSADINDIINGLDSGENSQNNDNPIDPDTPVYPQKDSDDAPYSLSEDQLRAAIYIPSTFTYGQKPPTIFVPGTGSYGGITFVSNLRKLLTGVSYADPVWLNIPGAMLGDAQVNSEYIAYAINYISAISQNSDVSVISWSQGGLDVQWAFTFWPSTRSVVSDFLPVSPDFHGTEFANLLCLSADSDIGVVPCDPSVIQQQYTSDYVATLRANGGASAYVPTTTFYSSFFDEVVEPMQGTGASAYILDDRNVGVSNNEVQVVCAGYIGGSFYGHAGVLYNPLTYALVVDALNNEGPGDASRLDIPSVCSTYAAPGLDLVDVLDTAGLIPIALVLLLAYPEKISVEPTLMAYV